MPFTIRAAFLMHTYQGADETGRPEPYPSPERLYRALVAAAYGSCGFESGDSDRPDVLSDEAIRSALAWLESHMPDAIRLPLRIRRNTSAATLYRDRGIWDKKKHKSVISDRGTLTRTAYDATADGDLIWQWEVSPDKTIVDTLDALCSEVPYLGEACCPVRIEATVDAVAYPLSRSVIRRDRDTLDFTVISSVLKFRTPAPGHLKELQDGHAKAYPRKGKPSSTESEQTVLSNTLDVCVHTATYACDDDQLKRPFTAPWTRCMIIPAKVVGRPANARVRSEDVPEEVGPWARARPRECTAFSPTRTTVNLNQVLCSL